MKLWTVLIASIFIDLIPDDYVESWKKAKLLGTELTTQKIVAENHKGTPKIGSAWKNEFLLGEDPILQENYCILEIMINQRIN